MANPWTGTTPTTLQASDFPQNIAPHAKYKANFAGSGTPAAPYIGGWVVDGPALSHDTEAHVWLKGQGFQHRGRRWLRIDRPPALASEAAESLDPSPAISGIHHLPGPWAIQALWPSRRSNQPVYAVYRERPGTIAEWMRGPSGRELRFRTEEGARAAIAKAQEGGAS